MNRSEYVLSPGVVTEIDQQAPTTGDMLPQRLLMGDEGVADVQTMTCAKVVFGAGAKINIHRPELMKSA